MFYNLKYINENGEEVKFETTTQSFVDTNETANNAKSELKLITFEGFGEVEANIQSTKSFQQDGSRMTNLTLEERYPYIEIMIVANDFSLLSQTRRHLSKVFSPKSKGTFNLDYSGHSYQLDVITEGVPSFSSEDSVGRTQIASVNFVAHDPYWVDKNINSKEIVSWVGGLTFPLKLPTEFSTKGEEQINIINNGDVETPVTIDISGKATNPCIKNLTTGEYIKVNRAMLEKDSLRITTEFGNKRVEQNGESVFNYIDLNSTFFSLKTGDNIIQMTTDDVQDDASVRISYKNRYIGV